VAAFLPVMEHADEPTSGLPLMPWFKMSGYRHDPRSLKGKKRRATTDSCSLPPLPPPPPPPPIKLPRETQCRVTFSGPPQARRGTEINGSPKARDLAKLAIRRKTM